MTAMVGNKVWGLLALALLVAPNSGFGQDEQVVRNLTPEKLEKFLQGQKLQFKKEAVPKEDIFYFTFTRGKFEVRLTSFAGKDLMLDCMFKAMTLDKINRWNIDAKFSRVSLHKDANNVPYSVLEYNLDLSGGVTLDALKQYLVRYDEELKNFDTYVSIPPPDSKIVSVLSDEKLEKVLKDMTITFAKKGSTGGTTTYDIELAGQKVRLQNFSGKDLMMAARFRAIGLEDVNNYNLNRKFIRAVTYKKDDKAMTALEANFDCEPGINESMVRHFISAFGEDVQHFADYVEKAK
jgi:hypothetical protein